MELNGILDHSKMVVETKHELFLRLCAINFLNALVKQDEYKGTLDYGMIKPKVFYLAKNLVSNNKLNLCDELYIRPSEDCLYIRSYGLQFGFHKINAKALEESFPQLCREEGKWDGVKLQPMAQPLYKLAKEVLDQNLSDEKVRERIQTIINQYN